MSCEELLHCCYLQKHGGLQNIGYMGEKEHTMDPVSIFWYIAKKNSVNILVTFVALFFHDVLCFT